MQALVQRLETIFPKNFSRMGSVLKKMLYPAVFGLIGASPNKFATLLLLLLVGFGQMSAHSQKEKISHLNDLNYKCVEQSCCNAEQNNQSLYMKPIVFGPEKQNNGTDVLLCEKEEKEEDELVSSKKYSEIGNYSTPLFGAYTLGYFFNNGKKNVPFRKFYSSYSSSDLYLVFQVFRL